VNHEDTLAARLLALEPSSLCPCCESGYLALSFSFTGRHGALVCPICEAELVFEEVTALFSSVEPELVFAA
jgi:hypothetical protein